MAEKGSRSHKKTPGLLTCYSALLACAIVFCLINEECMFFFSLLLMHLITNKVSKEYYIAQKIKAVLYTAGASGKRLFAE